MNNLKCPECGYINCRKNFVHAVATSENSGIWCLNCEISLEFDNAGNLDYYIEIDENTLKVVKSVLGKDNILN